MAVGKVAGVRTDSVIIITDPLTGSNKSGNQMGYLRSLPFLYEQGVSRYTFPPSWLRMMSTETFEQVLTKLEGGERTWFEYRGLSAYPFEYTIIEKNQPADSISFQHICQVTNQETDDYSDTRTTHKLLRAYLDDRIDELFLVTDTASFSISDTAADKPLIEELDHTEVLSYEKMAKLYLKQEFGTPYLSYGETLNIWLHHAAAEYQNLMSDRPKRIADLFEFDVLKPGIRTWDLCEFLASELAHESSDHINATVRPWIESDITKVEANIRNALQEFNYDSEAVRTYRETGKRPT